MQPQRVAVGALAALMVAVGALPGAAGNDLEALVLGPLEAACEDAPEDAGEVCADAAEAAGGVFGGLERFGGGISYADCTDDPECAVEVANFYFAPRVLVVKEGQEVAFENENPPGGSRHSVTSSDWAGDEPVLPTPLTAFGGGASFAAALQPGEAFQLDLDLGDLAPESVMWLGEDLALVPYHCYIHGASVMQGYLVVQLDE